MFPLSGLAEIDSSTCWKVVISTGCVWTVAVSGKQLALGFIVPDRGSSNSILVFLEYALWCTRYLVPLGLCYCVMRDCMKQQNQEFRLKMKLCSSQTCNCFLWSLGLRWPEFPLVRINWCPSASALWEKSHPGAKRVNGSCNRDGHWQKLYLRQLPRYRENARSRCCNLLCFDCLFCIFFFPEQMQSFFISSGFTAKKHIFILSLGANQFSEPGTD